ncbi:MULTISPECIES: DUF6640 family protein [Nocardia]|uniref:Integral membrane protein n=1 Tax=Nocardia farcinica (strain IFM 10152) TaxID=247156 RepID=Q5YM77_NOCFA|nr:MULTISPECIES: DUF6640 family protein [Nocardia]MBF6189257.1 hypothetical protein [Nocardia farcinica]MBF6246380.1 hypothetical protein [Nocardia elegans]MBF6314921.1 hypothetical protein [Nocardia farcinica]MBF6411171.1 hypothetical protein [Nocardia farcinica]PEH74533.1 hypothetical protein CRM89_29785 [Nocardia sp. FDAARGOS_372]
MTTQRNRHHSTARILVTYVAVATALTAALSELRDDAWPPHAKLHAAQYILVTVGLSVIAMVLLWQRGSGARTPVITACSILATPWLGLLAAPLFPGTSLHKPRPDNPLLLGLHPQLLLATVMLALLLAAVALTTRASTTGTAAR